MKPLEKALALAAIGCHVHPCLRIDQSYTDRDGTPQVKTAKSPYLPNGHLDATIEARKIQRWWTKWPDALVGVHAGPSRLVCLDIDIDNEKGVDGWHSLEEAGRADLPETFNYTTRRGGSHFVYRAPKGVLLDGTKNHLGMEGVDRRGGSSYFIWWSDDVPSSRKAFK